MKLTIAKNYQLTTLSEADNSKLNLDNWAFASDTLRRFEKCRELLATYENLKRQFAHCKNIVHIGIGGSSLGPEALIKTFANEQKNGPRFFFFNNADPELWESIRQQIDWPNTLFYIVSKSGKTVETLASLDLVLGELQARGLTNLRQHLLFCTDPKDGPLRQFAQTHNLACLEVPSAVGGRYSVFTDVGLFPAYLAGLDIQKLLQGAVSVLQGDHTYIKQLTTLLLQQEQRGVTQTVIMPYASFLREVSSWFVQLWSESLGKKHDLHGKVVHRGLTPVIAYGATDQHSQMQLFMDGPRDKFFLFLGVNQLRASGDMIGHSDLSADLKLFQHRNMANLLKAELLGTIQATNERQLPWGLLELDTIDEEILGELLTFFMCLTAHIGEKMQLNPFDQPGVELGKGYAYKWFDQLYQANLSAKLGQDLPLSSWLASPTFGL